MSLINRMLNDLEKRGAASPLTEQAVRPVPASHSRVWYVAAGGVFVLLSAVWAGQHWMMHAAEKQAAQNALMMTPTVSPAAMPVVEVQPAPVEEKKTGVATRLSPRLSALPAAPAEPVAPPNTRKSTESPRPEVAPSLSKQVKALTPQEQAELEFRKANLLAQQGQLKDAEVGFRVALQIVPTFDPAREALVAVLFASKQSSEAEKTLQEGLSLNPRQIRFAMLLARLQVDRGDVPAALQTLERGLPYAEQQADYHAFVGALLQRQSRHAEAVTQYQLALQRSPNSSVWAMGLGISLQALQRKEEALAAYAHAIETHQLSPQLQAFIEQRIAELKK